MLEPGTRIGSYEILGALGAGGMGEVYAARDLALDRTIAVKILPDRLASDPNRRKRFEREAKTIAALSHPNIVTIHSIEDEGGMQFLTMELIEGRTLDEMLGRPVALEALLRIAIPLIDAVAKVHEKGITHRDLKPANVMVTEDGRVKVLDFGLAKLRDGTEEAVLAGPSVTATDPLTGQGSVLGTVVYMSPEQAEGMSADERSDIFSLGVILFEMATGRRPFCGDTTAAFIASLLRDTPPLATELRSHLPLEFSRIVRRCLVRDPEHRYQSAKDLRNALEELKQERASGVSHAASTSVAGAAREPARWWWPGGVATVAVIVAVVFINDRARSNPFVMTFTKLTSEAGIEEHPSFSPDGKWMVYSATTAGGRHIFLQSVNGQNPIDISRDPLLDDSQPAFSPDGEQIAFRSELLGGGIFMMGRTGEFRRLVARAGYNPTWSRDGREIVYSTERGDANPYNRLAVGQLWAVAVASGNKRLVYEGDAVQPVYSPNGQRIAFWTVGDDGSREVYTIPAAGGAPVAVTDAPGADFSPAWSPDGRHLFFSSDRSGSPNLWRIRIDETSGKVDGPAEPLTTNSPWVADVTVAGDGRRVAYSSVMTTSNIQRFDFDPVAGAIASAGSWVTTGTEFRRYVDVSPDGQQLVFSSGVRQEDIFVSATDGSRMRQLTNDLAFDRRPTWSPDGRQIAFESTRSGPYQIWLVNSDGSDLRLLTGDPTYRFNYHAWSPAGDRMFATSTATWKGLLFDPRRPWHDQAPEYLPPPAFLQFAAMTWSPDGRRLAGWAPEGIAIYDRESQTYEVLTGDGGFFPQWIGADRLLYPLGSTLVLLEVATKSTREVLSTAPDIIRNLAVSRDGRQVFISRGANEGDVWIAQVQ
jgi:serine/threonine protein kinase/Tol biopolymer transport system component